MGHIPDNLRKFIEERKASAKRHNAALLNKYKPAVQKPCTDCERRRAELKQSIADKKYKQAAQQAASGIKKIVVDKKNQLLK